MKNIIKWTVIIIALTLAGALVGRLIAYLISHEAAKLISVAILFGAITFGAGMKVENERRKKMMKARVIR